MSARQSAETITKAILKAGSARVVTAFLAKVVDKKLKKGLAHAGRP